MHAVQGLVQPRASLHQLARPVLQCSAGAIEAAVPCNDVLHLSSAANLLTPPFSDGAGILVVRGGDPGPCCSSTRRSFRRRREFVNIWTADFGAQRSGRGRISSAVAAAGLAVSSSGADVETPSGPSTAGTRTPSAQLMPSYAESARTIVDICMEGTLSTLSDDGWPTATAVRFSLDVDGNPIFRLPAFALQTRNLDEDNRASLHVQLEQPGRRRPQCTLRGRIQKADDATLLLKLNIAWERRFEKEPGLEDEFYLMAVEQAFYASDMGEEEMLIAGLDYSAASADPLRDCASRIVEDMNRQHWEDVRRFCTSHAQLDVEVEEASMTWVDRLGFNLRVLTRSPQTLMEIRIPFSREVTDERDARSSLTMMAQVAWEYERRFSPPDVPFLSTFNVS